MSPLEHLSYSKNFNELNNFELSVFFKTITNRILDSLKIIYLTDKNIFLLILIAPFFY